MPCAHSETRIHFVLGFETSNLLSRYRRTICLLKHSNPTPKIDDNTLYQASYGVGSTDSIYRIRDFNGTPQGCIQHFDRLERIIDKGIPWPNEIARVPDRIMHDGKKWYTVAAGFNTPGKVNYHQARLDGVKHVLMWPWCCE